MGIHYYQRLFQDIKTFIQAQSILFAQIINYKFEVALF